MTETTLDLILLTGLAVIGLVLYLISQVGKWMTPDDARDDASA